MENSPQGTTDKTIMKQIRYVGVFVTVAAIAIAWIANSVA